MRVPIVLQLLKHATVVAGFGLALSACAPDSAASADTDTDADATDLGDGGSFVTTEDATGTTGAAEEGAQSESNTTDDPGPPARCDDGERNGDEVGTDCGGACQPCAPTGWVCEAQFYGDGVCQCGCAVADVDCSTADPSLCTDVLCPGGRALAPGQTLECVDIPANPAGWECSAAAFGDSICDCGCGASDFDCETNSADSCADNHCPDSFALDPEDNAVCLPPPADSVLNPSFEDAPAGSGDVPGWTVLDDVGGTASVAVVGQGQTTAPDGARALRLESVNGDTVGARTVRSSPFLPPPGTCTVTVAVGDSNEDSEFTDFGLIRVRAPAAPAPLDVVAEIDIDNRGMGGVSPPVEGYVDLALTFTADGASLYHLEIRARGSLGLLSYHADHVRIACDT